MSRAAIKRAERIRAAFQGEGVDVPPQFVHLLTQILLRHVLGNAASPLASSRGPSTACGRWKTSWAM